MGETLSTSTWNTFHPVMNKTHRLRHVWIQIDMFRPIRLDHTNCLHTEYQGFHLSWRLWHGNSLNLWRHRLKDSWVHVQVLPEVGVRQDNKSHHPELILCLCFLSFNPCLHLRVYKKVPVNAFCTQQVVPHVPNRVSTWFRGSVETTCENSVWLTILR